MSPYYMITISAFRYYEKEYFCILRSQVYNKILFVLNKLHHPFLWLRSERQQSPEQNKVTDRFKCSCSLASSAVISLYKPCRDV